VAGKKAKDLASLIRLNSWGVDERRRELGVLLARESDFLREQAALERQMVEERAAAAADPAGSGFMFGSFAAYHRQRREELAARLALLRAEIDAARERLAAAYRQLKVYEEVRDARLEAERKEEARIEQASLDEIALTQHLRRN